MLHTPDTISTLRGLLTQCHTIAVVGLSPQWHRPSPFAAQSMQAHGYHIVPVNPKPSIRTPIEPTILALLT